MSASLLLSGAIIMEQPTQAVAPKNETKKLYNHSIDFVIKWWATTTWFLTDTVEIINVGAM
jgi:hypothetical protein